MKSHIGYVSYIVGVSARESLNLRYWTIEILVQTRVGFPAVRESIHSVDLDH